MRTTGCALVREAPDEASQNPADGFLSPHPPRRATLNNNIVG